MDPHESVWTHELRLTMPPQARAVRIFGELLEALDALDDVRWRAVEANGARAELGKSLQLTVAPARLHLFAYRAALGSEAEAVLSVVAEVAAPPLARMTTRSQHLVPIDVDKNEATAVAARAWLGPAAPAADRTDCAVLLDGSPAGFGAHFQVEFGVVTAAEVGERLWRRAGRAGNDGDAPKPPSVDEYPDVAVFSDFTWTPDLPIRSIVGPGGCVASAARTVEYASEFVEARAVDVTMLNGRGS